MDANTLKAACLSEMNDSMDTMPYGEGFLTWLPLQYSDGDGVCLAVLPEYGGWLVSDQASTMARFYSEGIATEGQHFRDLWHRLARPMTGFIPTEQRSDVIAAWGEEENLGALLLHVSEACLRAEGLVGVSQSKGKRDFGQQVLTRVLDGVEAIPGGRKLNVRPQAPIRLHSGRERRVTAVVEQGRRRHQVAVQSLGSGQSSATRERNVDRCYSTFGPADLEKSAKIAVAGGDAKLWDKRMISDLQDVSTVVFFEETRELERALQTALGPAPAALKRPAMKALE